MPLRTVRVLELAQNLAGPYCGQILADLGARVTKVEPPGGDAARRWGPPFMGSDSPLWLGVNRNKRSVVLDLKSEAGRGVAERLLEAADVLLVASRHGAMARLGLDAATVRALHPRLVYVDVTAYGSEGPLRDLPGYDPLMQAHAGLMSITGHPDGPPARSGASIVDLTTGMWGAIAVQAALIERERTGLGSTVTLALLDSAVALAAHQLTTCAVTGEIPGRWGSAIAMIAPYRAFDTADGQVMIATGSDATFVQLCDALGLRELADDRRFHTNPDRVRHRDVLDARIDAATRGHTTAELLERLRAHQVPCSAIQTMGDVVADPQVEASGLLRRMERAGTSDYAEIAPPYRFDDERPRTRRTPPSINQDLDEVLAEAGYSAADVARLRDEGAFGS